MSPKYYKIILISVFGIVIVFFSVFWFVNQSIERRLLIQMEDMKAELAKAQLAQTSTQTPKDQKRSLTPTDLMPYRHITPHRKSALFKNQKYWDNILKDAFEQSDMTSRIQQGGVFTNIERSPDQFKKQIQIIDGRIHEYKLKAHNNPNDTYVKQKLQDLYMLKATIKILRDNIVSKQSRKEM